MVAEAFYAIGGKVAIGIADLMEGDYYSHEMKGDYVHHFILIVTDSPRWPAWAILRDGDIEYVKLVRISISGKVQKVVDPDVVRWNSDEIAAIHHFGLIEDSKPVTPTIGEMKKYLTEYVG